MTLKIFHFLSIILAFTTLSCSTKYVITDLDGRKNSVKGEIQNKILFKTDKGFPIVIEPDAVDSLYINSSIIITMNNNIYYESKIKIKNERTLIGYISANNSFIGENKSLAFDVNFGKIVTLEKAK